MDLVYNQAAMFSASFLFMFFYINMTDSGGSVPVR